MATVSQASPNANATVRAVAPGEAEITVTSLSPDFPVTNPPLRLRVVERSLAIPPQTVGQDLVTNVSVPIALQPGQQIAVSIDDPSLAGVAALPTADAQREIRISATRFQLHGLRTGSTQLRVRVPDYPEAVIPVTVAPSGFAFSRTSTEIRVGANTDLLLASYVLDPATLAPAQIQPLRPGLRARLALQREGDAAFGGPDEPVELSSSQLAVNIRATGRRPGDTWFSFEQPAGFTTPPAYMRTLIRVATSRVRLTPAVTGRDMVTTNGIGMPGALHAGEVTVTSADPSVLLVSASPTVAGARSATVVNGQVYLHGLAPSGAVGLRMEGPGIEPIETSAVIRELGLRLEGPTPGVNQMLASGRYRWRLSLWAGNSFALPRPGVTLRLEFSSSNPSVATVRPAFIDVTSASTMPAELDVIAERPGNAEIQVRTSAPGIALSRDRIPVAVRAPRLSLGPLTLGQGLQSQAVLTSEIGSSDNALIRVSSLNPDRILLSRASNLRGSEAITVVMPIGGGQSEPFFVQALAGEGVARIGVSADGFDASEGTVTLVKPTLSFTTEQVQIVRGEEVSVEVALSSSAEPVQPGFRPPSQVLMPGAGPVRVTARADDSRITAQTGEAAIAPGNAGAFLRFRGLAAGMATVTLDTPDGFVSSPNRQSIPFTVSDPSLRISCGQGFAIGKDLQATCSVDNAPAGTVLIATSSNPAAVVVSFDPAAAGAAQSSTTAQTGRATVFALQALRAEGTAEVLLRAPGYRDARFSVSLVPTVFFLESGQTGNLAPMTRGTTRSTEIRIGTVNAEGNLAGTSHTFRAGITPVRVDISSSDTNVARLNPGTVTFAAGDQSKSTQIQAVAAGSAVIRIATPTGFAELPRSAAILEVR